VLAELILFVNFITRLSETDMTMVAAFFTMSSSYRYRHTKTILRNLLAVAGQWLSASLTYDVNILIREYFVAPLSVRWQRCVQHEWACSCYFVVYRPRAVNVAKVRCDISNDPCDSQGAEYRSRVCVYAQWASVSAQ
jgi:hypothetical protein